ncbi:MAG: hypothetical protein J0M33_04045 [Anaerolineae bacterium]|nr:hypothetical protein [Anaerolineae bacterium]
MKLFKEIDGEIQFAAAAAAAHQHRFERPLPLSQMLSQTHHNPFEEHPKNITLHFQKWNVCSDYVPHLIVILSNYYLIFSCKTGNISL